MSVLPGSELGLERCDLPVARFERSRHIRGPKALRDVLVAVVSQAVTVKSKACSGRVR